MKFKIILAIMLIAALAGGYFYYDQQNRAAAVVTYDTAPVERMDLVKTVSATGTVQPRDSVEVSSKITARIKEVLVEENDEVRAGQTVAILDGKDFEAKRDQARFRLTNAEQN